MTYITSWERQGLAKGLEEGRLQKSLELTTRLLAKRFGTAVDPALIEQIKSLDVATIDQLAEDLIDFRELNDLADWLSKRSQT